MKVPSALLFLVCSLSCVRADIISRQLSSGDSYTNTVAAGQILQIPYSHGDASLEVQLDGQKVHTVGSLSPSVTSFLLVAGPATVIVRASGEAFLTVKTGPIEDQLQPSTSVVVPADATGPVKIILENSIDLVTWSAALPGTYGAGTAKRFFRIRAERQ